MKFLTRRDRRPVENVPPWPQQAAIVRLLLIDDDEDEFKLLRDTLGDIRGTRYELDWVPTYGEGLQAVVEGRYHAYLVDYRLGAMNGVELVREARSAGSQAPLIMLTGEGSRSVDMEAMEAGASDFLEKGRTTPALLERTIRYSITQSETTEALRRALRQISGVESLGRQLAEDGPRPETLDEVVRLVTEDFEVDAAAIYLMEDDVLRLAASRAHERPLSQIDPRGGRLARVIETGRPQTIPALTTDPDDRSADTPMEVCLPLMAEGRCVGILNAASPEGGLSADEQGGLRLVADRLAVALALNRAVRGRTYVAP